MAEPGRVVILNGASSVGKTTIARCFTEARGEVGEAWFVVALDDYFEKLPHQWFESVDHHGPFSDDGIRFDREDDKVTIRVGDVGRRLFAAYRQGVAVWANAGLNVIVDEVSFQHGALRLWDEALAGVRTTWVGVHCDLDVLESRELARGDRVIGLARGLAAFIHDDAIYDLEIDTTNATVDEVVAELSGFVSRSE